MQKEKVPNSRSDWVWTKSFYQSQPFTQNEVTRLFLFFCILAGSSVAVPERSKRINVLELLLRKQAGKV